jgi:hypothetical protein
MAFGDRFLRFPALFPRRIGGLLWGELDLDLEFSGGPYRFRGLDAAQKSLLEARFAGLCAGAPSVNAIETQVFRVDPTEFLPLDFGEGWLYTFDRDYRPGAVALAGVDFMALLDWQGQGGQLRGALFTAHSEGAELQCLAENYFRVLVAYRLLDLGGALLHSAGIISGGAAHLFLGPSGAGKSTISRLSLKSGRSVLSDDINALGLDERGRPIVQMLPFAGDLGRSAANGSDKSPLAALYRLSQGTSLIERLGKARALALLIACAPFVNADPFRSERLSQNLENLVKLFPTWQLHFELEKDPWPLIEGRNALVSAENMP